MTDRKTFKEALTEKLPMIVVFIIIAWSVAVLVILLILIGFAGIASHLWNYLSHEMAGVL